MKKILLVLALLFFFVGFFGLWFVMPAFYSVPQTDEQVTVTIGEGWTANEVGTLLAKERVIASSLGYRLYALMNETANTPEAGEYTFFRVGNSYRSVARTLMIGPPRAEVTIKVIEGMDLPRIAKLLAEYGVTEAQLDAETGDLIADGSVKAEWREAYPFLAALPERSSLEGYLFPNTYRVWRDQLPQSLIKKQLDEFAKRADDIAVEAKKQGRTLHEVVTLASIVEREIGEGEDRKIVAGIFMNRLKIGMALQSDATVSYLTRSGRARSTLEDLEVDSPYNTYKNKGLPPGPISNPGDTALEAALHPAETDYYYFLTDDAGKIYYATTFEQHQQNRRKAYGS